VNNRERTLMMFLGGILGVGALLYLGNKFAVQPHRELTSRMTYLEDELDKKERQRRQYLKDKSDSQKWYKLSLPANPDRAAAEYAQVLKPLLRDAGLTVDDFRGPPPQETKLTGNQKKAQHMTLPFQVRAKGNVTSLVAALDALQRMPVMHRVRSILVDRADQKDKTGKLGIQMTIEAMIVSGANNQPSYLPAPPPRVAEAERVASALGYPTGLMEAIYSTARPPVRVAEGSKVDRNFDDIPLRNPFLGLVPQPKKEPPPAVVEDDGPDVREFIRIDTIEPTVKQAFLQNRLYKSNDVRIKSVPGSGFDVFRIMNEDRSKVVVKGKVLRIDPRDVYFQVGEDVYSFHFSQTLAEAMKRPLSEDDLERLELTSLVDADFAKEESEGDEAKKGKSDNRGKTKGGGGGSMKGKKKGS
jgi:hypothetical protein